MHEALLYEKKADKSVRCKLCRHNCLIRDGKRGICMVRENRGGTLFSIFWGHPCAVAIDPIEKKPLFHFKPSSKSLSIATCGCNFRCGFCQNWEISQFGYEEDASKQLHNVAASPLVMPKSLADEALTHGCKSISYTYTEPTIFYEYAKEIAIEAAKNGIDSVFVTNGFMSRDMLDDFDGLLKAANVDLKAFRKETYKKVMKADLNGVLDSIVHMKKLGIWIEITTLVVPGMNDSREEMSDIANFIAGVGKEIPWHISRFHPQYKFDSTGATPLETIEAAFEIGKEAGLKFIYTGNIINGAHENTHCPKCKKLLIERKGYTVTQNLVEDSKCPACSMEIEGIF